ncbi:MAG: hypothetical protein ABI353_07050, partial [Isosphaeraceae bacterium]
DRLAEEEASLPAAIDRRSAAQKRAAIASQAAGKQIAATGDALERTGKQAGGRGAQGLIQFAYAIDDAQYGMRGLGNNLVQMAAQIGGVAGGLTTVTIAAATVLYNQWDQIAALINDAKRTVGTDLEAIKKQIAELEAKPLKLDADFTALDIARQKFDDLETRRQAFEAASKAMTDTQGKVAARVREAVVEHAGGTDVQSGAANLAKAIAERQKSEGTFYTNDDVKKLKDAEKAYKDAKEIADHAPAGTDPMVARGFAMRESRAKADLAATKNATEEGGMKRIQDNMIGGALKGIDAERKRLSDMIEDAPDFFAQHGVGNDFRAAIKFASAAQVRAEPKEAAARDIAKKNVKIDKKAQQRDLQNQHDEQKNIQKNINETSTLFRPKLQDEIDLRAAKMVKDGKSDAEIRTAVDAFVRERLKQANVDPKRIEGSVKNPGTASVLTGEAMDRFNARLGGRVGADSRDEAASEVVSEIETKRRLKAEREANQAPEHKAETEQEKKVNALARTNAPAVEGTSRDLTQGVNAQLGHGLTPDQIAARFVPEAARRLGKVPGMDPALVAATAEKIVREVIAKQAPQIAAAGGGAGAAAQLNTAITNKQSDAANRVDAADQRRTDHAMAPEIANQFQAYGANIGQAQAMAKQTLTLMDKGVNINQAMMASWQNMESQIANLNNRLNGISRQSSRRPGGNYRGTRTR